MANNPHINNPFIDYPYEEDPNINFVGHLWDGFPKVFLRAKNGEFAMKQFAFRNTKNLMAEKAFSDELNRKKFDNVLVEEGTLNNAWVAIKKAIGQVQSISIDSLKFYKRFQDLGNDDMAVYADQQKKLEKDYNDIKLKRDKLRSEATSKKEKYTTAYGEWSKADSELKANKDFLKTQKFQKSTRERELAKKKTQGDYIEGVNALNQTQKDYDRKCTELLQRFQKLEYQRLSVLQGRILALYAQWAQMLSKYHDEVQAALEVIEKIDPIADLNLFARQATANNKPEAHHTLELLQSRHGGSVASPTPAGSTGGERGGRTSPSSNLPKTGAQGGSSNSTNNLTPAVVSGKPYRVLYPFAGENQGEMPVAADEIVYVQNEGDAKGSGWAACKKAGGGEGYVPLNYLEPAPNAVPTPAAASSPIAAASSPIAAASPSIAVSTAATTTATTTTATNTASKSSIPDKSVQSGSRHVALYAYEGTNAGETVITEGMVVYVQNETEAADSGWAMVKKPDGTEGYVPFTYLRAEPESKAATGVAVTTASAATTVAGGGGAAAATLTAEVLYAHQAGTGTELSVSPGEHLSYLTPDGSGWVYCTNAQGTAGFVPENILKFL